MDFSTEQMMAIVMLIVLCVIETCNIVGRYNRKKYEKQQGQEQLVGATKKC